ncbi:hypothetical protein QML28_29980, partial [Klebsiella pneumoniae]
TVLDKLNEAGIDTYAVGKINDIFNGAGINHDMGHNKSNSHGIDNLIKAMTSEDFKHGFSFTNLVDFATGLYIGYMGGVFFDGFLKRNKRFLDSEEYSDFHSIISKRETEIKLKIQAHLHKK